MPQVEQGRFEVITASVGGSVLFESEAPEHLDCSFVHELLVFCQKQLADDRSLIFVVGGGYLARVRIADAKNCGVTNQYTLDQIGIRVTRGNANLLADILEANHFPVRLHDCDVKPGSATVYVRGGTEPGHTTDYVAVQAAHAAGVNIILNIGSVPGLHPIVAGGFDETQIISELSYDEYLALFPGEHLAGENIPFDRDAARLAKEYGMNVVLLNADFGNINRCLNGKDFIGTIIHA